MLLCSFFFFFNNSCSTQIHVTILNKTSIYIAVLNVFNLYVLCSACWLHGWCLHASHAMYVCIACMLDQYVGLTWCLDKHFRWYKCCVDPPEEKGEYLYYYFLVKLNNIKILVKHLNVAN